MILYLHGFRSAPASHKAQRLRAVMAARGIGDSFECPQLPASPRAAIALAEGIIAAAPGPVTLIGSSLGGCYAAHLGEKHRLKAVLVNPAVVAHLSLADYVGPQTHLFTGESFEFTAAHIAELKALESPRPVEPWRYWLMVETGDEVLDYRQAVKKYAGARQTVLAGGDHGFSRWEDYLDDILEFAGL